MDKNCNHLLAKASALMVEDLKRTVFAGLPAIGSHLSDGRRIARLEGFAVQYWLRPDSPTPGYLLLGKHFDVHPVVELRMTARQKGRTHWSPAPQVLRLSAMSNWVVADPNLPLLIDTLKAIAAGRRAEQSVRSYSPAYEAELEEAFGGPEH